MPVGTRLGAWNGYPFTRTSKRSPWETIIQIPNALRQRYLVTTRATSLDAWPPANLIWFEGTADSITDNGDGTLTMSVSGIPDGAWSGTSRWTDFKVEGACYFPGNYDCICQITGDDPYKIVRETITAYTYSPDSGGGAGTGTITFDDISFKNAIAAKFVTGLGDFAGCKIAFIKAGGLWWSDRLPTKPNSSETWKGTVSMGYYDASTGRGRLRQIFSDYNPSPYDTTAAYMTEYGEPNPPINWTADKWKTLDARFFDASGYLQSPAIAGNDKNTLVIGASEIWFTIDGSPTGGTFLLAATGRNASGTTTPIAYNPSAADVQAALETIGAFSGKVTVTKVSGVYRCLFNPAMGAVTLALAGNSLTGGSSPTVTFKDPDGNTTIKMTVTATGGNFTADVSAGALHGTITVNQGDSAVTVQTALTGLTGFSGKVTVTGTAPYVIVFDSSLGLARMSLNTDSLTGSPHKVTFRTSSIILPTRKYLIMTTLGDHGGRGMPERNADSLFQWYGGYPYSVFTHDPLTDGITTGRIAAQLAYWLEPTGELGECEAVAHLAFDVDAQIPIDDPCECGKAGDYISPKLYAYIRTWQWYTIALMGNFVPKADYTGADFIPFGTPARIFAKAGVNSWIGSAGYVNSTTITVPAPTITPPRYPYPVYFTINRTGSGGTDGSLSGIGSMTDANTLNAIGFISSDDGALIRLSWGFTRKVQRSVNTFYGKTCITPDSTPDGLIWPPEITPGGELPTPTGLTVATSPTGGTLTHATTHQYQISAANDSGETLACTAVSIVTTSYDTSVTPKVAITTNTYSNTLNWDFIIGASKYRVFKWDGTAWGLMEDIATPATTYTDDGSTTPNTAITPAVSNTTHNDCFGTGVVIYRGYSKKYKTRSGDGAGIDGPDDLKDGDLVRFSGDNGNDANAGRGVQPTTSAALDNDFWNRLLTFKPSYLNWLKRNSLKSFTCTYGTKWSIQDNTINFWDDNLNTGNEAHILGGTAAGGSTTTLTKAAPTGQESCWWSTRRFVGVNVLTDAAPSPYEMFVIEVYKGGLPDGWTVAADGSSHFALPTPSHSGTTTSGSPPTISSLAEAHPLANGYEQQVMIYGNNIQPGAKCVFTNTDTGVSANGRVTANAPGYLVAWCNFGRDLANWTVTITNTDLQSTSPFAFTTKQFYKVPISSSATSGGTLTVNFANTLAGAVESGDGYLIRTPAYEISRWTLRYALVEHPALTTPLYLRVLYSDRDSVYFAERSTAIPLGATITIIEAGIGEIWKYTTTAPAGKAEGRDYFKISSTRYWVNIFDGAKAIDRRRAVPTIIKEFGLFMIGDYASIDVPNELYRVLNQMSWTRQNGTFVSNHTPGTPEVYKAQVANDYAGTTKLSASWSDDSGHPPPPGGPFYNYDDMHGNLMSQVAASVADPGQQTSGDGVGVHPQKQYEGDTNAAATYGSSTSTLVMSGSQETKGVSVAGYAKASGLSTVFSCAMDVFARGQVDSDDGDESTGVEEGGGLDNDGNPADVYPAVTYDGMGNIITIEDTIDHIRKFDPAGTPLIFRKWAKVGSDLGQTETRISTNRVGDVSPAIPQYILTAISPGTAPAIAFGSAIKRRFADQNGFWCPDPELIFRWDLTYLDE